MDSISEQIEQFQKIWKVTGTDALQNDFNMVIMKYNEQQSVPGIR